jgi:CHAD domain-containing protein
MKKAPKCASAEQVHKLRTDIRRLEAAFDTLRPDPKHDERRLLRELGKIRKRAGKIRDMDVLTAAVLSVRTARDGQKPDPEQDCTVQLLHYLGAQRYKQALRLHDDLRKDGKGLGRRTESISERLVKKIEDRSDEAAKDQPEVSAESMATAIQLATELSQPPSLNHKNLHPYRIKVKEFRDLLRLAKKPGNTEFVETLGEVKDAIGEWHDWEELVSIAGEVLEHGARCALITKLKEVSSEKYDRALAITSKMRKRFVQARGGEETNPVLMAKAAVSS